MQRVHWDDCRATSRVLVQNGSYGTVTDWSPKGYAVQNCTNANCSAHKKLRWKVRNYNHSVSIQTQAKYPIIWHGVGWSPPRPTLNNSCIQDTLWRLPISLHNISRWDENYTDKTKYTLKFTKIDTFGIQAYVRDPYVFWIGNLTINTTTKEVSCIENRSCSLYMCLTNIRASTNITILILRQRKGLWLPVSQRRPWESSPDMHMLLKILEKVYKRTKRFLGSLIAILIGLIAITTTATVAGTALHQSIQTTEFVQEWHKNASKAWGEQLQIDKEVNACLVDLENAVLLLGEEVENLRYQFKLKCDWNTSTFFVTPHEYNHTLFNWNKVKKHLLGHYNNLTLDILKLQETVDDIQNANFNILSKSETMQGIADGLERLNPMSLDAQEKPSQT
ncbi:endogenous retrovirus group K member 18 Env polyprotein-like [Choloepus didactylus]|uniref:endogenous retrovirus group K member 18 Env polyprotein-like n=1 Tax=Choloepus didactylus TaxID=27675 RepID=UPI0018A03923|nr:endogenous retrovirus group K member 18 Env polyprotein-like [Choloepus didactylus]